MCSSKLSHSFALLCLCKFSWPQYSKRGSHFVLHVFKFIYKASSELVLRRSFLCDFCLLTTKELSSKSKISWNWNCLSARSLLSYPNAHSTRVLTFWLWWQQLNIITMIYSSCSQIIQQQVADVPGVFWKILECVPSSRLEIGRRGSRFHKRPAN